MTIRPIRLQFRRVKGFDLQALSRAANGRPAKLCTRPGKWGNPFKVERDTNWWRVVDVRTGNQVGPTYKHQSTALDIAIDDFRREAEARAAEIRAELSGHNLACTCALSQPCHVDVYLKIANG